MSGCLSLRSFRAEERRKLCDIGDAAQIASLLVEGVGLVVAFNQMIDVGARFDFLNLLGKQAAGAKATDSRALTLTLSIRPL